MTDLNLLQTLQKVKEVIDIGAEAFHDHIDEIGGVTTCGDENVHATPLPPPIVDTNTTELRKFSLSMALEMCWRSGDFDNLGREPDIHKQCAVYSSIFDMAKRIEGYISTGAFSLEPPKPS